MVRGHARPRRNHLRGLWAARPEETRSRWRVNLTGLVDLRAYKGTWSTGEPYRNSGSSHLSGSYPGALVGEPLIGLVNLHTQAPRPVRSRAVQKGFGKPLG